MTSVAQANTAQAATLSQTRQAATYAGLKKLGKAITDAKYNAQARGGSVRFETNYITVPTITPRISYKTEIVKTAQPVYEAQPVVQAVANGTRSISGFSDLADAGIEAGANFSIKVGDGDAARITFGANQRITLSIGSSITNFDYKAEPGGLSGALAKAMDTIPGLQASLDADGQIKMGTEETVPLTLTDSDGGIASPLAALGLLAGTNEANVNGTKQVQVGTEMVATGTKQVEFAREYERTGETKVAIGEHAVYDKPSANNATLTAASRKQIIDATIALDAAIGPKELLKGVANPFDGLRNRINIPKLKKATTQGDLGLTGLQIAAALKAYGTNSTTSAAATKLA